jgi:hypothetical protein
MTVQITNGNAKERVIVKRSGAQRQKRKIGKTPPSNFECSLDSSISFSFKICSGIVFWLPQNQAKKRIGLPIENINGKYLNLPTKLMFWNRLNL